MGQRDGGGVKKKQKDRDNDRDIMKHRTGRSTPSCVSLLLYTVSLSVHLIRSLLAVGPRPLGLRSRKL